MNVCAKHALEHNLLNHARMYVQQCLAIFCNNPPQGLSIPIGSEGGREDDAVVYVASLL